MRKEKNVRVSDKQLWQIDPVWGEGVPFDLLWDLALDMWLTDPPWELRRRAIREWRGLVAAIHWWHQAVGDKHAEKPDRRITEQISRYASPEQKAYARGERDDLPGGDPNRPGPVMGRS